jgi:hypothetical protein
MQPLLEVKTTLITTYLYAVYILFDLTRSNPPRASQEILTSETGSEDERSHNKARLGG